MLNNCLEIQQLLTVYIDLYIDMRWWWSMNCFCGMVDWWKVFRRDHCQRSSPSIANLWHGMSRVWTSTDIEFRHSWMKLCNSDTPRRHLHDMYVYPRKLHCVTSIIYHSEVYQKLFKISSILHSILFILMQTVMGRFNVRSSPLGWVPLQKTILTKIWDLGDPWKSQFLNSLGKLGKI